MKASFKFREDQRPLVRAKIPISTLGLPFLAGVAVGDPRDLQLDLTTAFESGPSFRVSYRPNESSNPFTLAVKTGIGAFGSPVTALMSITTEFNLIAPRVGTGSPGFSVVFKPRLGDFCFKKSASSASKIVSIADHGVDGEEMIHSPRSPAVLFANGIHSGGKVNGFAAESPAARGSLGGLLSDIEVMARSVLPIHSCAAVWFQWVVRVPQELGSSFSIDSIDVAKLPMLVMSKISIEHIPAAAKAKQLENSSRSPAPDEVAESCKSFRRELAATQAFHVHGEIEEGAVIANKTTGKSHGYDFITYKNMESAYKALQKPSKLIDGRVAVCNLACEGLSSASVSADVALRKVYIGGLSPDISSEILLNFFAKYGEIEEGSVAYDKETNKSRGFGFVTYKTAEAAKKAIDDPNKILGGSNITVKLADTQHKGKYIAMQPQMSAAVVPIAIPIHAGYPHAGKSPTSTAGPLAYVPYPYPGPYSIATPHYSLQSQVPYPHGGKKEPYGIPSASPTGVSGYPYYLTKP